ncbi:MAG TPA: RHS repeat-associated core domain-containing protein, partial [Blastocatellia bacterium]|nr:RHS repeat-associated core domain-containing protein [Blastocatellia bacterium]
QYGYDVMNRLLSKTPDASLQEPAVTFTYTATGRRQTMTDASGTTSYSYDVRDRLLSKATPEGTLSYSYDDAGNLLTLQSNHSDGVNSGYSYDELNRLSTVTDNVPAAGTRPATGVTSYSYDAAGNLSGYVYPNAVQTAYTYNSLNRLTDMSITKSAATLASYSYTLAAAGNRLSVIEANGRNVSYGYDALYRLTSETISGDATTANNGAISYSYDAVGNRQTRTSTVAAVPSTTSSVDANDHLASDSYDNNGNTVGSGSNTYQYDFESRLVALNAGTPNEVRYVYDGDGNRVAKTTNGVTTKYLVDTQNPTGYAQVVEEVVGGNVQRVYVLGAMRVSQQQQVSGSWVASFYGYDGHGSVRQLMDSSGAVTDSYTYDAFGNLVARTGTTANDYLYAGEPLDAALGMYYLRARYMNPASGRFWTLDGYEGRNFDPYSLHKYLYTSGNPTNKIDPLGNFEFDLKTIGAFLAIYGVVMNAIGLVTSVDRLFRAKTDDERLNAAVSTAINGVGLLTAFVGGGFGGPSSSLYANGNQLVLNAAQADIQLVTTAAVTGTISSLVFAKSSGLSGGGSGSSSRGRGLPPAKSTKWSSPDPDVGEVANLIEDRYPGHVLRVNQKYPPEGEIDIETANAIIEVTTSSGGKLEQLKRLIASPRMNPSGKPVIVFSRNLSPFAGQDYSLPGGMGTSDIETLLDILKP